MKAKDILTEQSSDYALEIRLFKKAILCGHCWPLFVRHTCLIVSERCGSSTYQYRLQHRSNTNYEYYSYVQCTRLDSSSSRRSGTSLVELGSVRQTVDLGGHLLSLRGSESGKETLTASSKASDNNLDGSGQHALLLEQLKGSDTGLEGSVVLSSLLLLNAEMSARNVESHLLGGSHLLQQLLVNALGNEGLVNKLVGSADVQVVLGSGHMDVVSHHLLTLGALVDLSLGLSGLVQLLGVRLRDLADFLLHCVSTIRSRSILVRSSNQPARKRSTHGS